ncbi:RxLR effector protein [Phytophthora megakarya]|uniref:RxLR effector protein n=1 Tax=Phytophthora megakarya TaxID=4795 RepID=A0A225VSL5_9STRA|nr:RxLR effector protein [Phytophthora megakarya]
MGRYLLLMLVVVVFVASGDALTRVSDTTEALQVFRSGASSSLSNQILHRRFLRSSDSFKKTNRAENVNNEERSIVPLKKLKTATKRIFDAISKQFKKAGHWFMKTLREEHYYKKWYRNGDKPGTVFKRLHLESGPKGKQHPRYIDYEEYVAFWTKKKGTIK